MSKQIEIDIQDYCPALTKTTKIYHPKTYSISLTKRLNETATIACVAGLDEINILQTQKTNVISIWEILADKRDYCFPQAAVTNGNTICNPDNITGIYRIEISCNGCPLLPDGFKTTTIR